jgi:hypothetical protein
MPFSVLRRIISVVFGFNPTRVLLVVDFLIRVTIRSSSADTGVISVGSAIIGIDALFAFIIYENAVPSRKIGFLKAELLP